MIGYWKFDGNTEDDTIAANHGVIVGVPSYATGMDGDALVCGDGGFDGAVTVPCDESEDHSQNFTLSAWIKPNNAGGGDYGHIYDSVEFGVPAGNGFSLMAQPTGIDDGDPNTMGLNGWQAGQWDFTSPDGTITINQWQHVAMVLGFIANGEQTGTLYINGSKAVSITGSAVPSSQTAFLIGNNAANVRAFDGLIDEYRIFNYAFDDVGVAVLYEELSGESVCIYPPDADLTGDCLVNIEDLAALADGWLECTLILSSSCP
jgi:hypothetical protein